MVIAADVRDNAGRVLARAGSPLDASLLRRLRSWGIPEISVDPLETPVGEEEEGLPALSPEDQRRLRSRFAHADLSHPAVSELLEQAQVRARIALAGGRHGAD